MFIRLKKLKSNLSQLWEKKQETIDRYWAPKADEISALDAGRLFRLFRQELMNLLSNSVSAVFALPFLRNSLHGWDIKLDYIRWVHKIRYLHLWWWVTAFSDHKWRCRRQRSKDLEKDFWLSIDKQFLSLSNNQY